MTVDVELISLEAVLNLTDPGVQIEIELLELLLPARPLEDLLLYAASYVEEEVRIVRGILKHV